MNRADFLRPWLLACCIAGGILAGCASAPPLAPLQQSLQRRLQSGAEAYHAGQPRLARDAFQAAIEVADLLDDGRARVQAKLALGAAETLLAAHSSALACYQDALQEASAREWSDLALHAAWALADWERQRGNPTAALAAILPLRKHSHDDNMAWRLDHSEALSRLALGDMDEADRLLQPWQTRVEQASLAQQAAWSAARARIDLARGLLDQAFFWASQALEFDRAQGHPPAIAADHVLISNIADAANQPMKSQQHSAIATRMYKLMKLD